MYIVYQTTNLVNGKKYIGVHNGTNKNYFGSGHLLKKAVKRHGRKNFVRKILFEYESKEQAYNKERELITEEIINSPEYYNIARGGSGGHIVTSTEATREKMKQNWNRSPERLHKLRTQNIGRKLSQKHKDALFGGSVEKNSKRYQVDDLGVFTLREFCDRMGYNLQSCKQGVWKRGRYKDHIFHQVQRCVRR